MEARYAFRKTPLLDECQVAPAIFEQVIARLYTCMAPLVKTFQGHVAAQHATTDVCGLLSDVAHKNVASIASRFGQSRLCPCKAASAGVCGPMHRCARS